MPSTHLFFFFDDKLSCPESDSDSELSCLVFSPDITIELFWFLFDLDDFEDDEEFELEDELDELDDESEEESDA